MFADIAATAIRQIFGQECVHLVGWSAGGFAALAVAARHPELVASATSICGFARGKWGESLGIMQRLASGGKLGQSLFRVGIGLLAQHRWIYNLVVRRYAGRKQAALAASAVHNAMFQDLTQHNRQALTKLFCGIRSADLTPELKQISAPVLIVGGRKDPVIPFSETQHLVSEIPNAELLKLEDCGHLFFSEAPQRTFEALDDWVTRHD
jgi:pimeloyl-ACP methyl ester carboxylesterase